MSNSKPVVIVEIGNDWLKIIEGRYAKTGPVIFKASFKKLAQIKEQLSIGVGKIWQEKRFSKHHVICCIPRQLITVRILELPSVNPTEIGEMINLQIGKQTPYSKDEIVFTYKIIDSIKAGYSKVMLAIAKRNVINERLDILSKAGIEPQKIVLSSEGIFDWFKTTQLPQIKGEASKTIILVDIDSNYSDFLFFNNGKLAFSKSILIGANHLFDPLGDFKGKFADELVHSKDVCLEEYRSVKPAKIYISGSVKYVEKLVLALSARLDIPCEIIEPSKDIKHDDDISVSAMIGFLIAHQNVAFNLMPAEKLIQKTVEIKRRDLTIMGMLLSAIIALLSLSIFIHIEQKNDYLAKLKARLAMVKNDSERVDKMRSNLRMIYDRMDAQGDVLSLIDEIYQILPEKIYLSSVSLERKGKIILRGKAYTMAEVFHFINKLNSLTDLKNVQNNYATINKEEGSDYDASFEIIALYNSK